MADDLTKTHRSYSEFQARWEQLKACLEGEEAIKKEDELYLPYPIRIDKADKSSEAFLAIYALYKQGAHFVEYTAEAVEDLISAAFRRPIDISPDLPTAIEYLDVEDLSKEFVGGVGSYGRMFAFADYPTIDTTPSMADDDENRAYISLYEPLDVLDWVETRRSGYHELVEVVIREVDTVAEAKEDATDSPYLYRKLYVESGVYKIDVWHENDTETNIKTYTPKKSDGSTFSKIPGTFIGTTSNTARIDKSPVIGISNTNLKHYQTWADLIHVQVYVGNPQLVLEGLNPGWNKRATEQPGEEQSTDTGVSVKIDAATILALEGENSSAKLLQIDTNSLMHYRTLETLEASMMEQGARIKAISTKAGVESAEALKIRSSAAMSKLASIVTNVEQALKLLLEAVGEYMGTDVPSEITINRDFFTPEPDGPLLGAVSEAEAIGTAPRGTTITYLKQIELVNDKDKTEDLLKDMELNVAQLSKDLDPSGKPIREGTKPKPSTDVK